MQTHRSSIFKIHPLHSRKGSLASGATLRLRLALLLPSFLLAGCARFHPEQPHEYVYVSARQVYLHDRLAAVANRVALVTNSEKLEVVEHGKRFVKVRTPKGEVGWIEDHAIIDDKLYAQFQDLTKKYAQAPVVASGQLRDDLYLHVLPGRETPHFVLIAGNSKVQMLARGTVQKTPAPGSLPDLKAKAVAASAPANPPSNAPAPAKLPTPVAAPSAKPLPAPAPPPMEDWWLVRDTAGHTGWLLSSRLDVDVPDEVGEYAEGQRMVAAYPIATVFDDGLEHESKGHESKGHESKGHKSKDHESKGHQKSSTGKKGKSAHESPELGANSATAAAGPPPTPVNPQRTEYVTVLAPPRSGLPYDFDQIRVFTWSLNHHRYETAYRLHGFQGYLPVRISKETISGQAEPVFSFAVARDPSVSPDIIIDPDTGVTRPRFARTLSFRMEGNIVKRTGADLGPIILLHDPVESGKAKAAAKKKKR